MKKQHMRGTYMRAHSNYTHLGVGPNCISMFYYLCICIFILVFVFVCYTVSVGRSNMRTHSYWTFTWNLYYVFSVVINTRYCSSRSSACHQAHQLLTPVRLFVSCGFHVVCFLIHTVLLHFKQSYFCTVIIGYMLWVRALSQCSVKWYGNNW